MNVLIVFAHPNQNSFNGQLRDLASQVLTDQGHNVQVSDLYAMNFKTTADQNDFIELVRPERFSYIFEQDQASKNGTFSNDIMVEQAKLKWADFVIFQYPMWWTDIPAILKGWFDRVFASGFAYGPGIYDQANLKGKKAMLSFTLGGSPGEYGINRIKGDLSERLFNIQHEKLYFVGMEVVEPFVAWDVYSENHNEHLKNLKNRLINLENLPVISFHKLEEYDETGALKEQNVYV